MCNMKIFDKWRQVLPPNQRCLNFQLHSFGLGIQIVGDDAIFTSAEGQSKDEDQGSVQVGKKFPESQDDEGVVCMMYEVQVKRFRSAKNEEPQMLLFFQKAVTKTSENFGKADAEKAQ